MNIFSHVAVVLLIYASPSFASEPIPAAQIIWKEHFGQSRADTNTLFCLMAQGGFRADTTNVQSVATAWLKAHPKALVVTVLSHTPLLTGQPSSRFAYVWIVQGSDNMNVEMVRQGCFAPATQMLMEGDKPSIPQQDYDAFLQKVAAAGKRAKKVKAGIWEHASK